MDDLPADGSSLPSSFYAAYSRMIAGNPHYSVKACMPANQGNSPWENPIPNSAYHIRSPLSDYGINFPGFSGGPTVFKVEADSTSGYSELPYYINNNTAGGDLLPRDPDDEIQPNRRLDSVSIKGVGFKVDMEYDIPKISIAEDLAPLVNLMKERRESYSSDIQEAWLNCLRRPDDTQVGLISGNRSDRNFEIQSDVGNDAPMPVISNVDVIAISVLLGIFLLNLIAVAGIYLFSSNSTLDAFVILRLGAQLSTDDTTGPLPALLANSWGVTALDRKHG
ncbi:hypothetical protein BDBG_06101 [Blastomyces gilchristii SLH14081]|uniref:Uncharacterized protein n=1 Tax=Blastomyces gilchristii (strain SLH14081) TaxID=559298 RepID=A0A179UVS3_BLAGS|nr:uncharacterized protein BDBG_06101 [Blastomyces gilchristii SLH14081]OAT11151.1 hypothetical protein BDBG_06101 [Blastomyces gilchristii SLH14081]